MIQNIQNIVSFNGTYIVYRLLPIQMSDEPQNIADFSSSAAGFCGLPGEAYSFGYVVGKYGVAPFAVRLCVGSKYGSDFTISQAKW